MKTLKILFFCLLATTAFAQSKQKTKRKSIIKTEIEAESTDFEVVQKVLHSERGPGKPHYNPKTGRPSPGYNRQTYRFSIKPLVDGIVIYSVNYGKETVKSDNLSTLTPFETVHYGCTPEKVAVPSGDFSKIKIIFEYKKNGIKKRFVVTNLEHTSYNAP
jgi:hypothetical protein